ncbi:MAG TPA: VCBS repeat-containing protein [Verrucomicrobiota bacterium]|nr:VCBS repeat-containing protein [Verrucomicrobiota bacterium]
MNARPKRRFRWLPLWVVFGVVLGESWGAPATAAEVEALAPAGAPKPSTASFQAASTRKMVERLAQIRETANPRSMAYLSHRSVARLERALSMATNAPEQIAIRFQLGFQLLLSGRTEDALTTFRIMEDQVAATGNKFEDRAKVDLRMRKAIAFIRLGEQENCQMNHNAVSCLFPLQTEAFHKLPRGSRSAIPLLNEQLNESPDDLGARWLLNLAYMTLGEWPDQVPAKWLIPPKVFASEYDLPRFPDVAGPLGLDVDDLAGGCVVDDFDNDGFLDVMASSWGLDGQLRLFHSNGNGSFSEVTEAAGLKGLVSGLNIQQTDYNNDGWLDLWVLRGGWLANAGRMPNSLLRNNRDGTFTDVTEEAGIFSQHPTQTSVWFDYDGDGWLDVFVGNETTDTTDPDPCELFHNNRDGTFTECAAASGLAIKRYVKGVACADYDRDGRPDLYLSCLSGPNVLLRNEGPANPAAGATGPWKFSDVSRAAGVAHEVMSFATWFFDYDNDGWDDLFVSGYKIRGVGDVAADYLGRPHDATLPKLYHNNRNGTFTDVTVAAHLNKVCLTMGCNFGDLDNDGWLDFYAATGNPDLTTLVPNRMFRNAEGRFFQEVTSAGGFGHLQKGHGVAFADLDNDGDQDVYAVMGGAFSGDNYRNALFLNPGNTNHWLKLKLVGTQSNRAAIGARLKVTIETPEGPRHIYKTVNSGASFGSSPLRQELGLANATGITALEVYWPTSGLRQIFNGLELDHAYEIREGDANSVALRLKPLEFDLRHKPGHREKYQAGL